jgi:hypothetical protein
LTRYHYHSVNIPSCFHYHPVLHPLPSRFKIAAPVNPSSTHRSPIVHPANTVILPASPVTQPTTAFYGPYKRSDDGKLSSAFKDMRGPFWILTAPRELFSCEDCKKISF